MDKNSLMYSSTSSLSSITTTASPVVVSLPQIMKFSLSLQQFVFKLSVIEFITNHRRIDVTAPHRIDELKHTDASSFPNIETSQRRYVEGVHQPYQVAAEYKAELDADCRDADQQRKSHSSAQLEDRRNSFVVSNNAIESPRSSIIDAASERAEKRSQGFQRVRKPSLNLKFLRLSKLVNLEFNFFLNFAQKLQRTFINFSFIFPGKMQRNHRRRSSPACHRCRHASRKLQQRPTSKWIQTSRPQS